MDSRVLVVFDVNVYLDIARLTNEPFSWERFDELASLNSMAPVPHPSDAAVDSLKALAVTRSGIFAGSKRLEVWSSDHIDVLVWHKAMQAKFQETPEQTGLGWSEQNAGQILELLVYSVTKENNVGEIQIPYGNPPLSHEDGKVYATARDAGDPDVYYERYCVTRDKEFLKAILPGDITVIRPHQWVNIVRAARANVAIGSIRNSVIET